MIETNEQTRWIAWDTICPSVRYAIRAETIPVRIGDSMNFAAFGSVHRIGEAQFNDYYEDGQRVCRFAFAPEINTVYYYNKPL